MFLYFRDHLLLPALLDSNSIISSLGLSLEDLELLADLFYLPFSHGPIALKALELGHWLRENSHLAPTDKSTDFEVGRC